MSLQPSEVQIDIPKLVGAGYGSFWRTRERYRVVKGGRGSKKSKTTALFFIASLMKYPGANLLVIRRHFNTHADSTFADLKWATNRLQVADKWNFAVSPVMAPYLPTGQRIIFRGLDDPLKVTSITVANGSLCWHWWEEVFEIEDPQEFDTVDETLRGVVEPPLWKQSTLTYNPWVNAHWTKERFWDNEFPDTFRATTTHTCNEWLDDADHKKIEAMKITNPERYRVVGLGEYGIPGGTFFEEFREDIHVVQYSDPPASAKIFVSLDYGLDMLAAIWVYLTPSGDAVVYKELHEPGLVVSEARARLLKVNGSDKPEYWYAPPDLWASNAETGRSQADAFWDDGNGIMFTMSKNARAAGCSALAEWIHPFEYSDPVTGETKRKALLTITKNNRTLINHISQIKGNETKPNEYDTEPHWLTHIVDAARGWAVMRTYPPVPPLAKEKRYSFDEDIDVKPSGGLYD